MDGNMNSLSAFKADTDVDWFDSRPIRIGR